MSDEAGGRGAVTAPRSLDELWALRSDFEDVPVPELGGTVLRVYALSGTARAVLLTEMADLASRDDKDGDRDPALVRRVLEFEGRAVAASLGYPFEDWDRLGTVIGSGAIERLYTSVARLSGLDKEEQAKAVQRLPRRRNAGSGTD